VALIYWTCVPVRCTASEVRALQVATFEEYGHTRVNRSQGSRISSFSVRDISGCSIPVEFTSHTQSPAILEGDGINLLNVTVELNRHVSPPQPVLRGSRLERESWYSHLDPSPDPPEGGHVYETVNELRSRPTERRANFKGKVAKIISDGQYLGYIVPASGQSLQIAHRAPSSPPRQTRGSIGGTQSQTSTGTESSCRSSTEERVCQSGKLGKRS
jgi:hypothetical protein